MVLGDKNHRRTSTECVLKHKRPQHPSLLFSALYILPWNHTTMHKAAQVCRRQRRWRLKKKGEEVSLKKANHRRCQEVMRKTWRCTDCKSEIKSVCEGGRFVVKTWDLCRCSVALGSAPETVGTPCFDMFDCIGPARFAETRPPTKLHTPLHSAPPALKGKETKAWRERADCKERKHLRAEHFPILFKQIMMRFEDHFLVGFSTTGRWQEVFGAFSPWGLTAVGSSCLCPSCVQGCFSPQMLTVSYCFFTLGFLFLCWELCSHSHVSLVRVKVMNFKVL